MKRASMTLAAGLVALALLRGLLAFVPSMWVWSLNLQRFLDPVWGWGLWAVSAATLLPPLARSVVPVQTRLGRFLGESKFVAWAAWAGGAFLVWVMADRVWFVGDFLIRQGNIATGSLPAQYLAALPLESFLHGALLRTFGSGSTESANEALR